MQELCIIQHRMCVAQINTSVRQASRSFLGMFLILMILAHTSLRCCRCRMRYTLPKDPTPSIFSLSYRSIFPRGYCCWCCCLRSSVVCQKPVAAAEKIYPYFRIRDGRSTTKFGVFRGSCVFRRMLRARQYRIRFVDCTEVYSSPGAPEEMLSRAAEGSMWNAIDAFWSLFCRQFYKCGGTFPFHQ